MFKDLYNSANDKINTDAAKDRVLKRLNGTASVRKKYGAMRVAALAACFILTVGAAGIYEEIQKRNEEILEKEIINESIEKTESSKKDDSEDVLEKDRKEPEIKESEEKIIKKTQKNPEKAVKEKKETYAPKMKEKTEEKTVSKNIPEVHAKKSTVKSETKEVIKNVPAIEFSEEDTAAGYAEESAPAAARVGGARASGGGSSVYEASLDEEAALAEYSLEEETVMVSDSEFAEYIGRNIPEEVLVPEGMVNETEPTQSLCVDENGEYYDASFTYIFKGEEKLISIEATKNDEKIRERINESENEKSQISGSDAVILKSDDMYRAYIAPKDVGYTVTTVGCNEVELNNVLESLK